MVPTPGQIQDAAYDRWERRGRHHGHDHEDWLRAEQDLLFTLNYSVIARVRSVSSADVGDHANGNGTTRAGELRSRICRFCEHSAPRARFSRAHGSAPTLHGDGGLVLSVSDECDECRQTFEESFGADIERFVRPIHEGWTSDRTLPASLISTPYVPIAAFKGLTRMALACLPRAELPAFEDAIEWVVNPDHDFDARAIGPLACNIHVFANPFPTPWATLSLRDDDDAAMPYALFHLGDGRGLFQVAVPLCVRDDDLDGHPIVVPHAAPSLVTGHFDDPIASLTVSLASPQATHETRIARL